MNKRKIVLGTIGILIVALLYLTFQNIKSIIFSKILPTQTSIFTGLVDMDVINKLRTPGRNGQISREQAIGLAELYCAQVNSLPRENPTNIEAHLMTETEARIRLHNDNKSFPINGVWLVSMDGMWEHTGPPSSPNATSIPLLFKHCNVIINAKTGEMIVLTN
jgi:hypothetical protein